MADEVRLMALDGVTELISMFAQPVLPGGTYSTTHGTMLKARLKNTGASSLVSCGIEGMASGGSLFYQWLRFYREDGGNPGNPDLTTLATKDPAAPLLTPTRLDVGTLAAGADVLIFMDWTVPLGNRSRHAVRLSLTGGL